MGVASLPAPKATVCGNGAKETGEACDDGNTLGNDTCAADCSAVLTDPPLPQSCMAVASPIVRVNTSTGQPITGATVTLYNDETADTVPLTQRFPYIPFPAKDILATGTTNALGQWVIPKTVLAHADYLITASAPGYVSQFTASPTCGSFTKTPVATLSLQSLSNYANTPSTPDITFNKARVDNFHYSYFERADREIVFPYVPSVRQSLCATLQSVDVTMHILGAPMPGFFPQGIPEESIDLNYHQTVSAKSVALFKMNAFRFKLPVGVYYFYFEFTLHRDDKTTETVMYYPQRAGYGTYPSPLTGLAPTSANSLYGTISSELIVYPTDYLGSFAETKAAQLTPLKVGSAAAKIPIVILNSGFAPAEFLAMAQNMIAGPPALDAIAPFAASMDQLDIRASPANFSVTEAAWPLSNNWGVLTGTVPLTQSQKLYMNFALSPRPLLVLLVKDPTVASGTKAGSGFCAFENGVSISISSAEYDNCMKTNGNSAICATQFDLSRIFLHELGHELGWLGEEYYEQKDSFFDVNDYETQRGHYFTPFYKPNTAFPAGLDLSRICYQTLFSYSSLPAKSIVCTEVTKTPLCEHVPWHDLVGHADVGCHMGGGPSTGQSRANLIKPQVHSIMDFAGNFNSVPLASYGDHVYGLANERALCQAILAQTQFASASCQKLCLSGCAAGMRCDLNGKCVAK